MYFEVDLPPPPLLPLDLLPRSLESLFSLFQSPFSKTSSSSSFSVKSSTFMAGVSMQRANWPEGI
jgi:hypothetical protein